MAPPVEINGYFGTLWAGAASLADGHRLDWRLDPVASLSTFAIAADVALTGPGTELAAQLSAGLPSGETLRLSELVGRAAWPLVMALAPDLDLSCDAPLTAEAVTLTRTASGYGGAGALRAGPGQCQRLGRTDEPVRVPRLEAEILERPDGVSARLSPAEDPRTTYAEARFTDADLILLTIFPEGAALVPGMPSSGEVSLEFPLSALR